MENAPSVRDVFEDIITRHPLAERDMVLEYLCRTIADPVFGKFNGTQWVRQIIRKAGLAVDENDERAFIYRAYQELEPADKEIINYSSGHDEDDYPEAPKTLDEYEGQPSVLQSIRIHRILTPAGQLAIEDATDAAEREIWGDWNDNGKADLVIALEQRIDLAHEEESENLGAEIVGLVLEEGLAFYMDRYILALLVYSEGGQRPCHPEQL